MALLLASPPAPATSCFLLKMRVDLLAPADIVHRIILAAQAGHSGYCCVTNVHQCILTYDDPAFRAVVNGADLAVPDSTILRRSLGLRHGIRTPAAVTGAQLMLDLCRAAERERVSIALIGGKDDEVLERLSGRLRERFPRLQIAFSASPPFREASDAEMADLAAGLRSSGARLIFVGLGCPKQERWMARSKPLVDGMMIGVGAAFDFNSGQVKPSPYWVHKAGLEWLYRMVREPRRLWRRYLTTSPRFIALLALDALRSPRSR